MADRVLPPPASPAKPQGGLRRPPSPPPAGNRLSYLLPRLAISCFTVLVCLLAVELAARLCLRPGYLAPQALGGTDLPPFYLVRKSRVARIDTEQIWKQAGKSNPDNLTKGDLWGIMREDPLTGYTFQENARSVNGWWQSNNLGARTLVPTMPRLEGQHRRVFVFGESYAHGSRVRQSQAWSSLLQARLAPLELVNMAVDGFGMGQAYLRYTTVRDAFDYDMVVFIFVPESDLWRDINTMRYLAEGWEAYTILPRMEVSEGQLRSVPGPYPIGSDIYRYDYPQVTARVREHLRRYDRFYIPLLYDEHPGLDASILFRLYANARGERQQARVFQEAISRLDGEAMEVETHIFARVAQDMKDRGKKFKLVVLPDPDVLEAVRSQSATPKVATWNVRIAYLRGLGLDPVDLMPAMTALGQANLDRGYDGTHYGPKANAALADILEKELKDEAPGPRRP